jgi:AcrR family transcriptional regulator
MIQKFALRHEFMHERHRSHSASRERQAVKAQSTSLQGNAPKNPAETADRGKPVRVRMNVHDRRRQILEMAADFFSEYGLTAQTRGLAAACGISQRLLYRYFPTKESLLNEVYRTAIAGPFKAVWFAELADSSLSLEYRLNRFYKDYFTTIFTSRWLRLFMYSSLAGVGMAPNYTSSMILQLLELIVVEAGKEQNLAIPADKDLQHEIGWTLHGALSHYAIRRHLYGFTQHVDEETIVAIHVVQFLGGFRAAVTACPSRLP